MKLVILVWVVAIVCMVIMCKLMPESKLKWLYGVWATFWAVLLTIDKLL